MSGYENKKVCKTYILKKNHMKCLLLRAGVYIYVVYVYIKNFHRFMYNKKIIKK